MDERTAEVKRRKAEVTKMGEILFELSKSESEFILQGELDKLLESRKDLNAVVKRANITYEFYSQALGLQKYEQSQGKRYFAFLAYDPAHMDINESSIEEAFVGLEAVRQGLIKGPLIRSHAEFEFIDGNNILWDVKSVPSRCETWQDQTIKLAESVQKQLRVNCDMRTGVLLNVTRASSEQYELLWEQLNKKLNQEELGRIVELVIKPLKL